MTSRIFPFDIFSKKSKETPKSSSSFEKSPSGKIQLISSKLKASMSLDDQTRKGHSSTSGNFDLFSDTHTPPSRPLRQYVSRDPFKIPPFWIDSPQLWFRCVESAFSRAGILTETKKFDEVLAVLDNSVIDRIGLDLLEIHGLRPYAQLKEALLTKFAPTEDQRLTAFLHTSELGDQMPSEMLKRLKFLIGPERLQETLANSLLKKLFLEKLPSSIRNILASNYDNTVDQLAIQADRIVQNSDFSKQDTTRKLIAINKVQDQYNQGLDTEGQLDRHRETIMFTIKYLAIFEFHENSTSFPPSQPKLHP
ncbi:uncharacterized protein LOC120347492 isoform X1 [Styela clava]